MSYPYLLLKKNGNTVEISVGRLPHPVEAEHYIETISILTDNRLYRVYLSPWDYPEAIFETDENVRCVKTYCNLHGLWESG